MALNNLPPELFDIIVENLFKDEGIFRIQKYRLISKTFADRIEDQTLRRVRLDGRGKDRNKFREFLSHKLGSVLWRRLENPVGLNPDLPTTIKKAAELVQRNSTGAQRHTLEGHKRQICDWVARNTAECRTQLTRLPNGSELKHTSPEARSRDELNHALVMACLIQNIHAVKALINLGADFRTTTRYFGFALTTAASTGNVEIVQEILHGITAASMMEVHGTRRYRFQTQAMLISAIDTVGKEHPLTTESLLDWLIQSKITVKEGTWDGWMQQAIQRGEEGIANRLMRIGRQRIPDQLFNLACDRMDLNMIRLFLNKRAVNLGGQPEGSASGSPLFHAVSSGGIEVVKALLDAGADVNSYRNKEPVGSLDLNLLAVATRCGRAAVVRLLLDRGAHVTPRPSHARKSPITIAGEEGYLFIRNMLIDELQKQK